MSSRLRDYADPMSWVQGMSSNPKNLEHFSRRASENSGDATRAKGGAMSLPDTGGKPALRSTSSPPKGLGADPYDKARSNLNYHGSGSFMPGVRRTTTSG